MSKQLKTIIQYIFFLGIGVFFAWLSLKNLDKKNLSQIKDAVRNARHWLIIPVFAILLASHFIRGLRWRLLIEPMGYNVSKKNAFFAVLIGYFTNQAVPRLGEVVKCTVLNRYEKVPVDKLIGTIILERLIDAITLVIVFGITLAIQPHIYEQIIDTMFKHDAATGEAPKKIATWLLALIGIAVIAIAVAAWMIIKKKTFADVIDQLKKIWKSVWQGISAIQHLKKRGQFILLTIILWSTYLLGGYIGFKALQQTEMYGIREAFTVLSAGSIGMIIPTPGGIGAYAYLVQKTMQLYGLDEFTALAFGWILWLVQTAVIVIGGLFSLIALPFFNRKKRSE